jgi:hypothetical protein
MSKANHDTMTNTIVNTTTVSKTIFRDTILNANFLLVNDLTQPVIGTILTPQPHMTLAQGQGTVDPTSNKETILTSSSITSNNSHISSSITQFLPNYSLSQVKHHLIVNLLQHLRPNRLLNLICGQVLTLLNVAANKARSSFHWRNSVLVSK